MSKLKKISNVLRLFGGHRTDPKAHHHTAILLAAGSGLRAGGSTTKQMRPLGGIPLIVYTLQSFDRCPYIHEIILVGKENELESYRSLIAEHQIGKVKKIICGGATRQDSARIGAGAVSKETEYISIHDGARCAITEEQIGEVIRTAYESGCVCAAACRAKDTVKITDEKGYVLQTPDRANVWLVQTPQTFRIEQYRLALHHAKKEQLTVTDDCMLAEAVGFPVKLVDCGYENLKVTTPEDFEFAFSVLKRQGRVMAEDPQQEGEEPEQ